MNPKNTIYSYLIHNLHRAHELLIDEFINDILDAHVFFIDNVSDYMWEISEKENWDIEQDFPNIAPPLELMWFEWRLPNFYKENKKKIILPGTGKNALFIKAQKIIDNGWLMNGIPFFYNEKHDMIVRPNFELSFEVSKSGSFIKKSQIIKYPKEISDETLEQFHQIIGIWAHTVCLALTFIHCRNVQIIPLGKGVHHQGRDRNAPSFRYHLLQIEPMKKVLAETAEKNSTGIKMALHICRGHFKDYRNGPGLFGKFRDVYWWDQQLRGDFSLGYVDKDYITPDKKETS